MESLFGVDQFDDNHLSSRIRISTALRRAVARGLPLIVMEVTPEAALLLADDIEFAVAHHPDGVPQDALMPPLDTGTYPSAGSAPDEG